MQVKTGHWTAELEASASRPLSWFEGVGPWTRKSFPTKKSIKAVSCVSGGARRLPQCPPILRLSSLFLLFDFKKLGQLSREPKRAKANSAFTLRQRSLITFQKWALLCSHGLSHQLQPTSQRFPGIECICEVNGSLKSTPGLPEKITVKEMKVSYGQRTGMSECTLNWKPVEASIDCCASPWTLNDGKTRQSRNLRSSLLQSLCAFPLMIHFTLLLARVCGLWVCGLWVSDCEMNPVPL